MIGSRWTELAAAYVLDALDPDERASFEEELGRNRELRAVVDEYRKVVGTVAQSLDPVTPPEGLKDRILRRARREQEDAPGADGGSPVTAETGPERAVDPRTRGPSPWPGRIAAAAAIVVAIALGVYSFELQGTLRSLRSEVAQLRADLIVARGAEARLDSLVATLSGGNVRTATLAAPDTEPTMRLIWNRERGTLLLAGAALPPAPSGRTYQLWGINEGEAPVSLGTFDSAPDGTILTLLDPGVAEGFDLSAVTEEPAGGSPQPTTTPFLVGDWSGEPS